MALPVVLHVNDMYWYPSRSNCVDVRTPAKHAPFGRGFSNEKKIADCLTLVLYKSNVAFDLPADLTVSDCSDQLNKSTAFSKLNNDKFDL